jgi:crossover junction endodeoxyribonuclease RusA
MKDNGWKKMQSVEFVVRGIPVAAGSKRFVGRAKSGRGILVDAGGAKLTSWRDAIQQEALRVMRDDPPFICALQLIVEFYMPRPKRHYRTGKYAGMIKTTAPRFHTVRPDATKLLRALEDAMTSIVYKDDNQIATQHVQKLYDNHGMARAVVSVSEI